MQAERNENELMRTDILEKANHSTRNAIVAMIKSRGEMGMKEIAGCMGISKMAVSKHLSNLERDKIVQKRVTRSGVGRPEYKYSLTMDAHNLFPTCYNYISLSALNFIREKMGKEGIDEFFERRKKELLERYSLRLDALPPEERVKALARMRDEEGFYAEGEVTGGNVILEEHNCPLFQVALKYSQACSIEIALFAELLGSGIERTHWMANGDHKCRYVLKIADRE